MSTITLPCQLLCASAAAYAINPGDQSGQYNPLMKFVNGHWVPDPAKTQYAVQYYATGFVGNPYIVSAAAIEAALVGKTTNSIIVAFRGTLPPALNWYSFFDWLQDFMMPTISDPSMPGRVHAGFWFAFTLLKDGILQAIRALDPGSTLPIYITGHSKGGGLAPIAAMYLKHASNLPVAQSITFAGPNCGNGEFVRVYDRIFPNHTRYENYLDLVPILPPDPEFIYLIEAIPGLPVSFVNLLNDMKAYDYQPVGNLMYIDDAGVAAPYSKWGADALLPIRIGEISLKLMELDWEAIADAHHASCGYRYMQGTCVGTVCPA